MFWWGVYTFYLQVNLGSAYHAFQVKVTCNTLKNMASNILDELWKISILSPAAIVTDITFYRHCIHCSEFMALQSFMCTHCIHAFMHSSIHAFIVLITFVAILSLHSIHCIYCIALIALYSLHCIHCINCIALIALIALY